MKIKIGDILKSKNNPSTGKVLEVLTQSALLSDGEDYNSIGYWFTFKEIEELYDMLKEKWVPKMNEYFYIPYPNKDALYYEYVWYNSQTDNFFLSRNIVFKTKEEAIATAEKMLKAIE